MDKIEWLKSVIMSAPNDRFNTIITKGILDLDDNKIETVSFIFWLCFLVETKLEELIKEAISAHKFLLSEEVKQVLIKDYGVDFSKLEYFRDKIKIYEIAVGKNKFSELLWKINQIRNAISHTRIGELKYEKEDLFMRKTKEKLLIDLMMLMVNQNGISGNE